MTRYYLHEGHPVSHEFGDGISTSWDPSTCGGGDYDCRPVVVLDFSRASENVVDRVITGLQSERHAWIDALADEIRAQLPPKPLLIDVHASCSGRLTDIDGVRYCDDCGYFEGATRLAKPGERA